MSYQVLARKWRPHTFAEMVGQEHVLRALINALDSGRIHHAFLFTGTRGVGKTTIARILAKSLNCEQGVSSSPCGECTTCREIDEGRFVDLIEVDAASRTKVEDTRELLDNVQYAPTRGRYKVYLIDEVHMLSNHSFNALLKTLEEPPPHVKFLLATTDPQRLPVTILSRCLQFSLKRLSEEVIGSYLEKLLVKEGVTNEKGAIQALAHAADGSMRDALSLLDQAIAYGAGQVAAAEVHQMLGTVDRERVFALLEALADCDGRQLLTETAALADLTPDYSGVLGDLISVLHRIALVQIVPDSSSDEETDGEKISALAKRFSAEDVQLFYQIAIIGRRDLPLAPEPRTGFEMVLLRMLAFHPDEGDGEKSKMEVPSQRPSSAAPKRPPDGERRPTELASVRARLRSDNVKEGKSPLDDDNASMASPAGGSSPTTAAVAIGEPSHCDSVGETASSDYLVQEQAPDTAEGELQWHSLVKTLPLTGMARQLALHCSVREHRSDRFVLQLEPSHEHFLSEERQERLRAMLEEYVGRPVQLRIELGTSGMTPARLQALEAAEQQESAEVAIRDDATVKALIEGFDGQIVPDSVRPRRGNS